MNTHQITVAEYLDLTLSPHPGRNQKRRSLVKTLRKTKALPVMVMLRSHPVLVVRTTSASWNIASPGHPPSFPLLLPDVELVFSLDSETTRDSDASPPAAFSVPAPKKPEVPPTASRIRRLR